MPISQPLKEETYTSIQPLYSLRDLLLSNEVLGEITDCVSAVINFNKIFLEWGLNKTHSKVPRSLISLYGLPGTGKTMAAHAVAKELGKKIIVVKYADLESKYVGDTPKNIERLFSQARDEDVVIFFDEADAILSKRIIDTSNAASSNINQTRSTLLNILNSYEGIVIFATNFIQNYDEAFFRRMIKHIEFKLPDYETRRKIFQKYTPKEMPNDFNFDILAERSEGSSGADISMSILNSALRAVRVNSKAVSMQSLLDNLESIQKIKLFYSNQQNVSLTREILPDIQNKKDAA